MKRIKVMTIFGTRPEAIKMAPLVLALRARPEFECYCCVTAQHRQMLDSVLDIFKLRPDFDLNIMQQGQSLSDVTSRVLGGLGQVFAQTAPDLVLVHGDTTTTFSGALAAFYAKVQVGHVEAGLRTYDKYSPYPEEMNRRLVGQIADLHFCPTIQNAQNLRREGIDSGIFVTGNTVIDAMSYTVGNGRGFAAAELQDLPEKGRLVTLTCHRRENYGAPMEQIFRAVARLARENPDITVVYPVHMSPYVRQTAERCLAGVQNIRLIQPLDAADMHKLMDRSYLVMTDSGGIQEEAPALGKPVLVLRRETERPEAVQAGTVALAGVEEEQVYAMAQQLLHDQEKYQQMARAVNPYGDGQACRRICDAIAWHFGCCAVRPADFNGGAQ